MKIVSVTHTYLECIHLATSLVAEVKTYPEEHSIKQESTKNFLMLASAV